MQKLEAELSALMSRAALLTEKRAAAQDTFDAAVAARDVHMLKGNLDDEKIGAKLQASVDTAASALAGFDNVIAAQAVSIAEAEEKLAVERLAVARKTASDDLTAKTDIIERQIGPWLEATRALAASTTAVGDDVSFESCQVGAYLRKATGEVEMAIAMVIPALRASAAAIVAGHQAIPRGPEIATPAPLPPAPVQKIWTTRPIAWTENGQIKKIDLNEQRDVPVALAKRAIALSAAVPVGHKDFGKQVVSSRRWNGYAPPLDQCVLLDDAAEAQAADDQSRPEESRILHSAADPTFERIDRGKGFVIKVPAGNTMPGGGQAA